MPAQAGNAGARYTVPQLIEAAEREAFMRRRVYPRRVADGRMRQDEADRQIDLMEAIVTRLRATAHI